jgi:hypothetical protein
MPSSKNLVCCAMPFGYGPAAKLMAIAPLLRPHLQLTFIGHSIAYELVARCQDLFDQVIQTRATEALAQHIIGESIGVLSVMEREFASLANQQNKPLYVVDSLLWMRDRVPDELTSARIYWAQNFPSLSEVMGEFQPQAAIVGPIVPIQSQPPEKSHRTGLLVNLGGCQAPDNRRTEYQLYAEFVLQGVVESGLLDQFQRQVTVTGGIDCIEALSRSFSHLGIEFVSLSHQKAQVRMSQSAVVLTAPGLTTTLECFRQETPTFFLPPENYSQWCILRHLRQRGLAPCAFHWDDLCSPCEIGDRLCESERNRVVRPTIIRLTQDSGAKSQFQRRLRQISAPDYPALVQRQSQFFQSLGVNGAKTIATNLIEDLLDILPR